MSGDAAANAARLADELSGMEGAEAWQVFLGYGSNLFIDLGGQVELPGRKKTRVVGEWTLWVSLAAWRLQDAARVLVACEEPRPVIAEKITVLKGRRSRRSLWSRPPWRPYLTSTASGFSSSRSTPKRDLRPRGKRIRSGHCGVRRATSCPCAQAPARHGRSSRARNPPGGEARLISLTAARLICRRIRPYQALLTHRSDKPVLQYLKRLRRTV